MNILKILITIILTFSLNDVLAQKVDYSQDWRGDFYKDTTLYNDTVFHNYVKEIDFSKDFMYIGDSSYGWEEQGIFSKENQRIDIVFISVVKDNYNPYKYEVKGKSRLKGNICDFKGFILITDIKKQKGYAGIGVELNDTSYYGRLIAEYEFKETFDQFGAGVFKGVFSAIVHIHPEQPQFDGFYGEFETAKYQGSFVGTWQSYKTLKLKKCIWTIGTIDFPYAGDFRIPMTEKEIEEHKTNKGCKCKFYGEYMKFNPKYINNGWVDYWKDEERWWENKKK